MRIIFHNPHKLWYKRTISNYINDSRPMNKYEYLFDSEYSNLQKKMHICIEDGKIANNIFSKIAKYAVLYAKLLLWLRLNKLSMARFKIIFGFNYLEESDLLILFVHQNLSSISGVQSKEIDNFVNLLSHTKAYKVANLSHYGYNITQASINTRNSGIDLFVSENNLNKNSGYFNKYFEWYSKDVYVLPFVFQSRFKKISSFEKRINKAMAIGTITHPIEDKEFVEHFLDTRLHPMREEIYKNSTIIKEYIDSYLSPIKSSNTHHVRSSSKVNMDQKRRPELEESSKGGLLIQMLYKLSMRMINGQIAIKSSENKGNYYSFDIVARYNQYKMFICPEEIIGLPGIGFVEGMACGTAFIGIRDPMYSDIGLVENEHYICYDGTIKDLIKVIKYYQNNPEKTELIASQGYKFVREKFNAHAVCSDFYKGIRLSYQSK